MTRLVALIAVLLLTAGCSHGPKHIARTGTCGSAHLFQNGAIVGDGTAALSCFSRAVAACAPASLAYSETGVDTGSDTLTTLIGGNPCRARYTYQNWSANFGGSRDKQKTTDCTVRADSSHVDFTCTGLTDEIPTH